VAFEFTEVAGARAESPRAIPLRSDADVLRIVAVLAGLAWAIAFPLVGVHYELQLYGDGSLFSYAVAAQDAWAFHWHNISGRVFVYLAAHLPAQMLAVATGDARSAIGLYGLLFFAAPLLGLIGTFIVDRSVGRTFFCFACGSTACVCPLVFGSPTEMWMAHAVFWPAVAANHYARPGISGFLLILALMLALVLSHEGALLLAAAIVLSLLPYGLRDAQLRRGCATFGAALLVWIAVKTIFPPDPYIAGVLMSLAAGFFDLSIFTGDFVLLLVASALGYGAAFHLLARLDSRTAPLLAFGATLAALGAYWLLFDGSLHTESRYYLRTAVVILTPALGLMAAACAPPVAVRLSNLMPSLARLFAALAEIAPWRAIAGLVAIVTLVHAVETWKFVNAWTGYKAAVRTLAAGAVSDAGLGDARFVSTARLPPEYARLAWASTAPYLSVLLTPDLAPRRLVVAPEADFFWISCETATANVDAHPALPRSARELVQTYSCLHRKPALRPTRGDINRHAAKRACSQIRPNAAHINKPIACVIATVSAMEPFLPRLC
jgi:hypothetical protein